MSRRQVYLPKIASTIWSVEFRACEKSSTNGTSRSSSCLESRYHDCESVGMELQGPGEALAWDGRQDHLVIGCGMV